MIVNHNMSALSALRNMNANSVNLGQSSNKLSSGLRINQAADDAAGLAISQSMNSQIEGLNQATRNAQDSTSLIQTADGALNETQSILTRMKTLATQAANSTYTDNDRQTMQAEIDQLKEEIDRISNTTSFNNKNLLDGSMSALASTNDGTDVFLRGSVAGAAGTYKIDVQLAASGTAQVQTSGIMRDKTTGLAANSSTTLANVAQFYDKMNKFMLDTAQTITLVQGDGKSATIRIQGTDTLKDVADRFNAAIRNTVGSGGLDQGAAGDMVGYTNTDLAKYNVAPGSSAFATGGSFVLSSAIAGTAGQIHVVASTDLMNAFGFTDYQKATDEVYSVDVTNTTTKDPVVRDVLVQGNELRGIVHENVDLRINASTAQSANYNSTTGVWRVTNNTAVSSTTYLHLTDNSQVFQIGSNEKQTMNAAIGDMSTKALGVDAIQVTDKDSAGKAITTLAAAIDKVSSERSKLGAVQNRLSHTITNLGVESENLTSSMAAIKDVDMASEMVGYSKLSILSQTANAMLAKANQTPQLVTQLLQ